MRFLNASALAAEVLGSVRLECLGGGTQRGLADGLGLEEGPEIGRLDMMAQRRGLSAFSGRLG